MGLSVCWHVFACNCTSWSGWQCRPDKLTQIVRGDRVSALCSISLHLLLVSDRNSTAWWMDAPLYLYPLLTPLTVFLSLTHFSPLGFPSSTCHLRASIFFVICLSSAIYFSSTVINFLYFWWQQGHGCGSLCLFMGKRWSDNVEICSWSFKLLWQNDLSLCCCLSVVAYIHFSTLSAAGGFS